MNHIRVGQPKRSKILFVVGGFLILFSLVFISVGYFSLKNESEYAANGETVDGTVLSRTVEERWSTDSSTKRQTKTTYYNISYNFIAPDGREIESTSGVSRSVYESAQEGAPITIQYLKQDPDTNRVYQEPDYIFGSAFCAFGLLTILAGLGTLWFEIKTRAFTARLMRDGVRVDAVVESVAPGNLSINNVQQWQIEYSYTDLKGVKRICKSSHVPPQVAGEWNPGDKGAIRYDKDNSEKSIWIGRV
ncbi:MAG TPA: DUF3592 domain-containing protein [Oligoflexia bacterium]|nr:DUF3592 domain-containing protein [Oligoflexia bacterium]HMP48556.1 DUF3592 domain-containing protein [Oligoflexia bacterium]